MAFKTSVAICMKPALGPILIPEGMEGFTYFVFIFSKNRTPIFRKALNIDFIEKNRINKFYNIW